MNRKNLLTLLWGAVFALSFAGSAQGAVTPTPMDHWEIDPTQTVTINNVKYNVATDGLWTYAVQINGSSLKVYDAQSYAGNDGDKATLDLSKPFFKGSEQIIVTSYDPRGWNSGGHPTKILNGSNFCLNNGLFHLKLPDTLLSIGNFYNYASLESITPLLPASLNSLPGERLFDGCNNLTGHLHLAGVETWSMSNAGSPKFDQLTFEGRVKTIGSPLWAKSTVTNVNILTGHPVSIGGSAFADCTNLKTVRVGVNSAIASVGDNAFSGCSAMERIDWDDHEPGYAFAPVTTFGLNPFNNGGFKNVKQPLVLTNINWTTQNGYRVPDINPNNSSSWCPFKPTGFTDLLFVMKPDTGNTENLPYGFWSRANTGGSYNGLFTGMTGLTNAVIRYPAVSMLSEAIFMDCSALETVTLDATKLEKIGSRAFGKCAKLKRIVTPNVPRYDPSFAVSISTLTTLGNIAFSCCSALTSVSLGSLGSPLLIQGTTDNNPGANNSGTFASCGLERVELMASELNLGTDSTYSWVFYNCKSLKRVDISAVRVVGVGNGTFGSCSALADVYWTSPAPEKVGTGNAIFGSVNTVNHVMRGQWPATPSGVIPCITWTDSKSGTWKVHSSQTVPLAAWTPVAGAGFVILGQ